MATIKKDIGAYSAYAIAVKHGYEGTEAEWVAAQEKARVDSEAAAKAAQAAQEAAEAAREQAQTAKTGAENAKAAAAQQAQTATGAALTATQAAQATQTAKEAAEQAQTGAEKAKTGAETAKTEAQTAKEAAEKAAQEAKAAQTGAEAAKTGAVEAQGKAEEAAQGVAADREQIGANKSGLEAAQQELMATKEQLSETKAALASTQDELKKAQRAIQFQAELNKGQTWDFEVDDSVAYSRTVPSGAKAGAVMDWGGKTVGWNQLVDDHLIRGEAEREGISFEKISAQSFRLSGTATSSGSRAADFYFSNDNSLPCVSGHKYLAIGGSAACNVSIYGDITHPIQNAANSFIETATKTGSSVKFWARLPITDGQAYDLVVNIAFIDLTLLYGPGNEPTDTTDPRIAQIEAYAAAHPEYNAGELASAQVDEVDVIGVNILRPSGTFPVSSAGITAVRNQDSTITINGTSSGYPFFEVGRLHLKKGTTYFIPSATRIMQLKDGNRIVLHDNNNNGFTPDKDYPDVFLEYTIAPSETFSNAVIKPIVSVGALRDYSPYTLTTYPIPDAVKQLPGYGWSAGSVSNTIERTENGWQYVQRVGSVDLGTLDYTKEENTFRAKLQDMQIVSTDVAFNGRCKSFISIRYRDRWTVDGTMSQDRAKRLVLIHSGYSNIESFLSYVRGTLLYYELATPITTDITALMGDALAPFAVEAGGSITLHHPKADEGFAIDVPAKIQYITKLSEVSSNG